MVELGKYTIPRAAQKQSAPGQMTSLRRRDLCFDVQPALSPYPTGFNDDVPKNMCALKYVAQFSFLLAEKAAYHNYHTTIS